MYKIQLAAVPRDQLLSPIPLPLQIFVDLSTLECLQELQATPWCGGFCVMPLDDGPVFPGTQVVSESSSDAGLVHQGMQVDAEHWENEDQYRAPKSGPSPSRNQRKRFRKAEAPSLHHSEHESPGTMAEDRSTGIDPSMAWISAKDDAGVGKVWRTPSENPLIVDRNLTQQMQTSPYHPDHRSYRSKRTRDEVDPAIYDVFEESKRMSISLSCITITNSLQDA